MPSAAVSAASFDRVHRSWRRRAHGGAPPLRRKQIADHGVGGRAAPRFADADPHAGTYAGTNACTNACTYPHAGTYADPATCSDQLP